MPIFGNATRRLHQLALAVFGLFPEIPQPLRQFRNKATWTPRGISVSKMPREQKIREDTLIPASICLKQTFEFRSTV